MKSMEPLISIEYFRCKSPGGKDTEHHFEVTYFSVRIVALVKPIALGGKCVALSVRTKYSISDTAVRL